jgi:hypothetical protein
MSTSDSFSNETPLPEPYPANRRQARVEDAEKIRQAFVSSRRIMPPKVVQPAEKDVRKDEQ